MRVFPEAGSVYHARLPCRVNDAAQSCLFSRSCCMTFSFAAKASVLLLFLGSTLYVHLRGKARLPVLRQFVNHSALFAPYNALMYLFSGVPSKQIGRAHV